MKAFLIKIKDSLKKTLHSNFFLGVIFTTLIFISGLIWQSSVHQQKLLKMEHDIEIVLTGQNQFYAEKLNGLEQQVEQQEMMLQRAGEIIGQYRQMIENLARELQKHQQKPIDPNDWT